MKVVDFAPLWLEFAGVIGEEESCGDNGGESDESQAGTHEGNENHGERERNSDVDGHEERGEEKFLEPPDVGG